MKKKEIQGYALLLLASVIWGFAFAAQSAGMDHVGPFTFTALRSLLGALALFPVVLVIDPHRQDQEWIKGGIACGCCLSVAMTFQQMGLVTTSAGKSGFLTALYILFVPLLGVFLKRKIGMHAKLGVAGALAGFYLLCMKESFSIASGDILLILSAVVFAIHILVIDYYSPKTSGLRISMVQFLVAGSVNFVFMLLFEKPDCSSIFDAWLPIVYAGILSSGVGYTLQIIGQKHTKPTQASLVMSLESVFSVLAGWLVLNEALSVKELMGCALIFGAICIAQIPEKKEEHNGTELL